MMCWMKYLPLLLCYCIESCCLWLYVQWDSVMDFCSAPPNYPSHSPFWMRSSCTLNSGCIRAGIPSSPQLKPGKSALLLFVLPVRHVNGFPNSMLPCSHLSLVLFLKMSSNNDYSTLSIFTSSEEGAFLLLGKCHEKWDNGFVIKCNWYLCCNSDKDIYLIKNSIWRKNNLPYLKFPTASIFFFKIRSACSKNTN